MRLSSKSLLGRRMWTVRNLMFAFIFLSDFGKAQQLDECVSGVVEVVENSASYDLTCSQTSGNVDWRFATQGSTLARLIGTCNSSCTLDSVLPAGFFSLTRLSSTSTRLTVKVTTRSTGRTTFHCLSSITNSVTCQADVVAPAVLSPASVTMTRAGSGWTVQGSVDVTTVYSSLGRYSCQWFQTSGTGEQSVDSTLTLSPDPSDTNNTQNRTGHCSFSKALPSNPGTYTYRVVVSPGETPSQRSVEIASPSAPNVACSPSPYVPDNTKVTCTCNTQSVGKPAGRLMWSKGNGNNNPVNTGNDGDTSLTMTPYTMTRGEGDVQFRCDVDWVTRVTGQPYSVNVSYGPEDTTMSLNSTLTKLTVQESATVVFYCRGNGRPTPGIVLTNQDSGVEVNRSQSSPLTHAVSRARCEDAGVYTCIANNDVGPDQRDTRTLYVNCKPRSELSQLLRLSIDDQTVTRIFHVIAYPVPDRFNFTFLGPNVTPGNQGQEVKDVQLNAACASTPGVLYKSTCMLAVFNVSSSSAFGFYSVRVANTEGYWDRAFQLTSYETSPDTDGPISYFGLAVGLGVALAVIVVCNVGVALWRWGWRLPCAGMSRNTTCDGGARKSNSFEECSPTEADIQQAQPEPYYSLKMEDVGLRSPYEEISQSTRQGDSKDKNFSGAAADPAVYQNQTFK